MKLIYSAVLILVLACTANAQLTLDWCRCAGAGEDEELTDLISLPDGSVIAIGFQYRTTGNGDDNPYIVKVDDNGTLLWTFTEDYQSAEERIYCGTKSSDGNIVVAGSFDPTTGTIDNGYALKINAATGTLMWRNATHFGNSGDDFIYGMLSLANNVTLMVGKTGGEAWAFKIDGDGSQIGSAFVGPSSSEMFRTVVQLGDGRFVALGRTDGDDPYAVLLSSNLVSLGEWTMTGGVGSSILSAVAVQGTDVIFSGILDNPDSFADDAMIHRIRVVNNSIQAVWSAPHLWDYYDHNDVGNDIALDQQGNVWVVMTGDFGAENDVVVRRLNAATGSIMLTYNVLTSDQPDNAGAVAFTDLILPVLFSVSTQRRAMPLRIVPDAEAVENETDFMIGKYQTCYDVVPSDANDPVFLPEEFRISAYPNPFNTTVNITFQVRAATRTIVDVYDILGKQVVTLFDDYVNPGSREVAWDATNFTSGIYIVRLSQGETQAVKKIVLLK